MTVKKLKEIIKRIQQLESDSSCTDSAELIALSAERDDAINRLSIDDFAANCIYMHVIMGYSWQRIADIVSDGMPLHDTADSIRMRCKSYMW